MEKLITAIELSPSGINLVAGYTYLEQVYILKAFSCSSLTKDSQGYPEKESTAQALVQLLSQAKKELKRDDLGNVLVLLPPDEFQVKEVSSSYATIQDEVSLQDYKNACVLVRKKALAEGTHLLYADPYRFSGENYAGRDFPLGKNISTLNVAFDVHYIANATYERYSAILKEAKLVPSQWLVSSFGAACYLNPYKEMANGYVNVELEQDHTSFSYVNERRMVISKTIPFGVNQALEAAAEKLGTTPERMKELTDLFGLRDNAGFSFYTKEKYSLVMIADSLKFGFSSLLNRLQIEFSNTTVKPGCQFVLSGTGLNIEGLDKYFGDTLRKRFVSLNKYVLGAREKNYLPCLGAIKLTANSYMDYLENSRTGGNDTDDSQNRFSRG